MRALRFLNVAGLSLLVATSVAMYAQEDKPRQEEPRQEEPRQAEPRPDAKTNESRPATKQDEMKAPRQDEARPSKPDKREEKQNEKQSRDEMRSGQAAPAGQEAHGRPAGKSAHIPDDKFHASFGQSHHFRVQRTTVENGQSGFVYGGYNFVLVDAWPSDWAYTDDCYVDYVDGEYFLFDLLHPGMRIALFVVM